MTRARREIIDYIHDRGSHITADEIIRHVQKKYPRTNKSTIYRTLELLEKDHHVVRSETGDRAIYHHAEQGHHHHVTCQKCGKMVDCEEDLFKPVEQTLRRKHGFIIDFRHVFMQGLCRSCAKKSGGKRN